MSQQEPIVDIHDPEINVEELMQRIRIRIQQRRLEAQLKGLNYDAPSDSASILIGAGAGDADLQGHLHRMRHSAEGIFVTVSIRDQRLPLINTVVNRLKEAFHVLVVMYVNVLAGRQVAFNRAAVEVVFELARKIEVDETRRVGLETELADLRDRVARLELERLQ